MVGKEIEEAIRVVFPKANMESDEKHIYVEVPTYSSYYTTHQLSRKAVSILREKKGRFDKNTKTWTLKEGVLE